MNTNADREPLAVPINQVKGIGGWGTTKTYELINAGELTAIKVGGRTLIPVAEIRALIDRKIAEAKAARAKERAVPKSAGNEP